MFLRPIKAGCWRKARSTLAFCVCRSLAVPPWKSYQFIKSGLLWSYPHPRKSAVGLREAAKETYVFYERAHAPGFHDLVLGILNRANVIPPVWQAPVEMPTLISLIASGAGISLFHVCVWRGGTNEVCG